MSSSARRTGWRPWRGSARELCDFSHARAQEKRSGADAAGNSHVRSSCATRCSMLYGECSGEIISDKQRCFALRAVVQRGSCPNEHRSVSSCALRTILSSRLLAGVLLLPSACAGPRSLAPAAKRPEPVVYFDISAGEGPGSGIDPSLAVDPSSGEIFVAANNHARQIRPSVFICSAEGTGCRHVDVSAGREARSGYHPRLAISGTKLMVVTTDWSERPGISLFRCDKDGSGCNHIDLSAGQIGEQLQPIQATSIALGPRRDQLMVLSPLRGKPSFLDLYRCMSDGTRCVRTTLEERPGAALSPDSLVMGRELLVATTDANEGYTTRLIRCDHARGACSSRNLTEAMATESGHAPSLAVDHEHSRLLIATHGRDVNLLRCAIDGSACVGRDIFSGRPWEARYAPQIVVDSSRQRFYVVSVDQRRAPILRVDRCDLDGVYCQELPVGLPPGTAPSAELDPSGRLLIAATNPGREQRASLLRVVPDL